MLGTKENRILRAKPRPNSEVNSFWMCDHGRKTVVHWGAGERAEVPMLREDGRLTAVDWTRALDALTEALRSRPGGARAIVSAGASNESLYTIRKLMDLVGFEGGQFRIATGPEQVLKGFPKLALRKDRAPNGRGAELLGFEGSDDVFEVVGRHRGVVFVLEDTLEGAAEELGDGAALFVYVGSVMSGAARKAHIVLPSPTFAEMEGTFTNFEGRVQRFSQALHAPGLARPIWLTGSVVLERLGGGRAFRSAGAAFAALAEEFSEYTGLGYESLGLWGAPTAGAGTTAAP